MSMGQRVLICSTTFLNKNDQLGKTRKTKSREKTEGSSSGRCLWYHIGSVKNPSAPCPASENCQKQTLREMHYQQDTCRVIFTLVYLPRPRQPPASERLKLMAVSGIPATDQYYYQECD